MSRESLMMIKPGEHLEPAKECVRALAESMSLTVEVIGEKVLTREEAAEIYYAYHEEEWFGDLMDYLTSDRVAVVRTFGEDAIEKTIGIRDKIRGLYGTDRRRNAVHAPKDEEQLTKNLSLFMSVFTYEKQTM